MTVNPNLLHFANGTFCHANPYFVTYIVLNTHRSIAMVINLESNQLKGIFEIIKKIITYF